MSYTYNCCHYFKPSTGEFRVANLNSASATIAAFPDIHDGIDGWRLLYGWRGRSYQVDVWYWYTEGIARPFRAAEYAAHVDRFPTLTAFLTEALPMHTPSELFVHGARVGDDAGWTLPNHISKLTLHKSLIREWSPPSTLKLLGLFYCRVVGNLDLHHLDNMRWIKSWMEPGVNFNLASHGSTTFIMNGGWVPDAIRAARPEHHDFLGKDVHHPINKNVMSDSGCKHYPQIPSVIRIPDDFAD